MIRCAVLVAAITPLERAYQQAVSEWKDARGGLKIRLPDPLRLGDDDRWDPLAATVIETRDSLIEIRKEHLADAVSSAPLSTAANSGEKAAAAEAWDALGQGRRALARNLTVYRQRAANPDATSPKQLREAQQSVEFAYAELARVLLNFWRRTEKRLDAELPPRPDIGDDYQWGVTPMPMAPTVNGKAFATWPGGVQQV